MVRQLLGEKAPPPPEDAPVDIVGDYWRPGIQPEKGGQLAAAGSGRQLHDGLAQSQCCPAEIQAIPIAAGGAGPLVVPALGDPLFFVGANLLLRPQLLPVEIQAPAGGIQQLPGKPGSVPGPAPEDNPARAKPMLE
ncbi:MAG: hypothetical protein AB1331_03885 [Bacillota bacterium]